ncbi:hypothetical protein Mal64_27230 [Pseudobythopirellula maris]|uniref:DUF4132 domain-containing protein n=1 Tax=Pseudobythopirellula maris TaxID=2527991 RepID=A0A5C5ZJ85_9BACT|nr:DUF4132 domain-containing protein [Pseudobythopirellula maris]TWT87185.1 hypothetical protein Mal64_27230 [Pseudobythopirellula maris]
MAILFGGSKLKNPDRLSKEALAAIRAEAASLPGCDKKTAAQVVRYVVDDEDAGVLQVVSQPKQRGNLPLILFSPSHSHHDKKARARRIALITHCSDAPPGVWMRMGHVFKAVNGSSTPSGDNPPEWLPNLISQMCGFLRFLSDHERNSVPELPIALFERILKAAELPPDLLVHGLIVEDDARNWKWYSAQYDMQRLGGWSDHLAKHQPTVRGILSEGKAGQRVHAIANLKKVDYEFEPIFDVLVAIATGPAKSARAAAAEILQGYDVSAHTLVEQVLREGSAAERNEAAQLAWRLDGEGARRLLESHAEGESSDRVKQTIARLLSAPVVTEAPADGPVVELPPLEVETGVVELPEEARAGLSAYLRSEYERAYKDYEQALERWNAATKRPRWYTKPSAPAEMSDKAIAKIVAFVEGRQEKPPKRLELRWHDRQPLGDWLAPPAVKLIHVVRLANAFGNLNTNHQGDLSWHDQHDLEAYRERSGRSFGLRELDAAVATLKNSRPGFLAAAYLGNNNRYIRFCDWEPEAIWPAFADCLNELRPYLASSPPRTGDYQDYDYWWSEKRRNAFRVLASFPNVPPEFVPQLWDLALGESKTVRPLAQTALASLSDKAEKIVVALADGKQAVRASAADWLGQLGDPTAIEPLKKAYAKEKQDLVKGAMLTALEALGADISEYFDRKKLLAEAIKGLAKPRPKGLAWFKIEALPAVHWADNGKSVPPEILEWWAVQSVRLKTATPGPLLRRYLALCRRDEAAELAKRVLQVWIAQDTRSLSMEEASSRARQESQQLWAQYGNRDGWFKDHYQKEENLYQERLRHYTTECLGSASGEKGLLAITAAAGDADCAKICEQYLRKWYGHRVSQCKSLLETLAWIDDPLAIQVLLSIANRFRTKSLRKEAETHVAAIAEREGWTLDQLADRTLPDGGFERELDESGEPLGHEAVMELDYGPRKFHVRLGEALQPVIVRDDGKEVKSLPAPAKNDDEEMAKAAKKQFSKAKKTVKEVVKRQTERLYEALCTQRAWRGDEWRRYLADHPIAGPLCGRVVWAAFEPSSDSDEHPAPLGCFRPLEDGTLTDEQDAEFQLSDGAVVRLAHACNTDAATAETWDRHLKDYDVTPLFRQFGRSVYQLPEELIKQTELTDFEGHCLTTFQLRGKATKAGFARGQAEDGGCFMEYRKRFPSLELEAVLGFTGSMLPEEDVAAALTALYFVKTKNDGREQHSWRQDKVLLGKVPPVLLSECRYDVEQIASAGTGYDPEWRTKSYFG